ncbi:MAG: hypothetical protein ACOVMT_04200 [Caulobacter sp.]
MTTGSDFTSYHRPGYIRTSRGAVTQGGVIFESWRVCVSQYALISEDGRAFVGRNSNLSAYHASVDGASIGRRYRSETGALRAAVAAMRIK